MAKTTKPTINRLSDGHNLKICISKRFNNCKKTQLIPSVKISLGKREDNVVIVFFLYPGVVRMALQNNTATLR